MRYYIATYNLSLCNATLSHAALLYTTLTGCDHILMLTLSTPKPYVRPEISPAARYIQCCRERMQWGIRLGSMCMEPHQIDFPLFFRIHTTPYHTIIIWFACAIITSSCVTAIWRPMNVSNAQYAGYLDIDVVCISYIDGARVQEYKVWLVLFCLLECWIDQQSRSLYNKTSQSRNRLGLMLLGSERF